MSEADAIKAVEAYFKAFNAEDGETIRTLLHYPHVIIADRRVIIMHDSSEFISFSKGLSKREGWHHSTLDSLKSVHTSEEKVHFTIEFSRYKADGTRYASYNGIWIMTKEGGDHWGLLARSIYLP